MAAISSRARNQIATKPSQRFETPTVECPRGGDVRKYASAEERAAKNQKTTVRHFGFTEKVYGLPCTVRTLLLWKRHHIKGWWWCDPNLPACFHLDWRLGLRPKPASLLPSGLAVGVATRTCRPLPIQAGS